MGLADIGGAYVRQQNTPEDYRPKPQGRGRAVIGFTPPTVIYDQMRRINVNAAALDTDFTIHVANAAVKQSWKTWHEQWKAFFEKTLTLRAKLLGNPFWTDELQNDVNAWGAQLQGFHTLYERQVTVTGDPVPQSSAPDAPPLAPPPGGAPKDEKTSGMPWWGITLLTLGGVGITVGGFFFLRKQAREMQAKRRVLEEKVLPLVMGSTMGPIGVPMAQAMAARDPAQTFGYASPYGIPPSYPPSL